MTARQPLPAAAIATMTGLELMQAMIAGDLPGAPIAGLMNMRGVRADFGTVTFEGVPGPEHYNPLGTVHGGYAATLLDSAMGCAVHTTLPTGTGFTSIDNQYHFRPADHERDRARHGAWRGNPCRTPGRDGARDPDRCRRQGAGPWHVVVPDPAGRTA